MLRLNKPEVFCEIVCLYYAENSYAPSNDEKYELLYRKIYMLEMKIDEIIKTIQDINVKVTPKKTGFFS